MGRPGRPWTWLSLNAVGEQVPDHKLSPDQQRIASSRAAETSYGPGSDGGPPRRQPKWRRQAARARRSAAVPPAPPQSGDTRQHKSAPVELIRNSYGLGSYEEPKVIRLLPTTTSPWKDAGLQGRCEAQQCGEAVGGRMDSLSLVSSGLQNNGAQRAVEQNSTTWPPSYSGQILDTHSSLISDEAGNPNVGTLCGLCSYVGPYMMHACICRAYSLLSSQRAQLLCYARSNTSDAVAWPCRGHL